VGKHYYPKYPNNYTTTANNKLMN